MNLEKKGKEGQLKGKKKLLFSGEKAIQVKKTSSAAGQGEKEAAED